MTHSNTKTQVRSSWEENFGDDKMLEGNNYRGVERLIVKSPVIGFSNREIIRFRDTKCLPAFEYYIKKEFSFFLLLFYL